MFVNDIVDAYIFKIIVLIFTIILAVWLGNWLYNNKEK